MSWWVYLKDEHGNTLEVAGHQEGGIQNAMVVGEFSGNFSLIPINTSKAEMSVTYNYSSLYDCFLDDTRGFVKLHAMTGADSIPLLKKALKNLPDEPCDNYWSATPGNAGHILAVMLGWAEQHPEGIWRIH